MRLSSAATSVTGSDSGGTDEVFAGSADEEQPVTAVRSMSSMVRIHKHGPFNPSLITPPFALFPLPEGIDHFPDLVYFLSGYLFPGNKRSDKCRQRSPVRIFNDLFALGRVEFLAGNQGNDDTIPVLQHPLLT